MDSQYEMTIQTMELVNGVLTCSRGAEVKGGRGGREPHGFLGNLQESSPSSGGDSSDVQSE